MLAHGNAGLASADHDRIHFFNGHGQLPLLASHYSLRQAGRQPKGPGGRLVSFLLAKMAWFSTCMSG
jgi:hypothetical protein